ncbi:methionyl-tRNA formyltransferase [Kwoniella shandongensis]|uniref:methionyl-tRNA formyltransferase n=1 Tax=Kwoniella shandongensis TaxID=1734106 RepID=A0A5M6BW59_9TREE|nr:methionyl-tRNA formyltransferase [Kwoniella shandongensis]KAA5527097.1 methionyl-tRNA formyltransferase [Kwoniella shandongensis]
MLLINNALRGLPYPACRPTSHGWLSRPITRGFGTTRTVRGEPFRILFCGSDEFSVASLKAVHQAKDLWSSIDVVVPAEKEIGRGGKHVHKQQDKYTPALRLYAEMNDLPTHSVPTTGIKTFTPPEKFNTPSSSHILLTASFGHIIPVKLLNLFPPEHRLNVHPSLLPRWRGAAPVQWTIAEGDEKTGVSVQRLERFGKGIDSGDIVGRVDNVVVPTAATYDTLLPHLANLGGELLVDVLRRLKDGTATFVPQDETQVTLAPKITHDMARVKWSEQSAVGIDHWHRAIHHQYPVWTTVLDVPTQLIDVRPIPSSELPDSLSQEREGLQPGTAILHKSGKVRRLFVYCAKDSWLEVIELQTAGKKVLGVKDWWNGLAKGVRDSGRLQLR